MGRVLVACEESQVVTKVFRDLGHIAFSCDVQPCSGGRPEWHIQDDVLLHLDDDWDLMIAHPPCRYLSYAGIAHWNKPGRLQERLKALDFFGKLYDANIARICIENPRGCASPTIAKYTQAIQPYYFGEPESKLTWLWLRNLPPLEKTDVVKPNVYGRRKTGNEKGKARYFVDSVSSKGEDRRKVRSKTFYSIAKAMGDQWGPLI